MIVNVYSHCHFLCNVIPNFWWNVITKTLEVKWDLPTFTHLQLRIPSHKEAFHGHLVLVVSTDAKTSLLCHNYSQLSVFGNQE